MKAVSIFFEDNEIEKLRELKKKSQMNWHDFVLECCMACEVKEDG